MVTLRVAAALAIVGFAASVAPGRPVRLVARVPADTPTDAAVFLAGSLPAVGTWKADGIALGRQRDGTYAADLDLADGQTLAFKLTRGTWATVEKRADGSDLENRAVTISADVGRIDVGVERWSAGPTTAPASTVTGRLDIHTLDSAALHGRRAIRVWLPPGYAADPARRYTVLYLFDGQNCFDRRTSGFGQEWGVDETLTRLIPAGTVPPLIVVGLDNGPDRIAEYTFDADPRHGGGHADATEAFLLGEVIPFVDRTYRTAAGPAHTMLGGSSLGGLLTLGIARRHPGAFAAVAVVSPSLWWNGDATLNDLVADASSLAGTRVWLDVGTAEEPGDDGRRDVDRVRRLDAALTRQRVEHRLTVDEGAGHNEAAWARRFPAAVTYLTTGK